MPEPALTDGLGRIHRSLRISVTDRCNLRCRYCMPAQGLRWTPGDRLLATDEIVKIAGALARHGVTRVRLTGGEPLLRPELEQIVAGIAALPEVEEVALTSNAVLLADRIDGLVAAGLGRVNLSLDSLDPQRFNRMARRDALARALEGIDACLAQPTLRPLKLNTVVLRGLSEPDIVPLAEFARRREVVVRFLEAMPLDAQGALDTDAVMPGAEVRAMVERHYPLVDVARERSSAPATRWRFADGAGELQFVSPVTEPFCTECDRLRITCEGHLTTCLFARREYDLATPLRAGAGTDELIRLVRSALADKQPGHGLGTPEWQRGARSMSRIGG